MLESITRFDKTASLLKFVSHTAKRLERSAIVIIDPVISNIHLNCSHVYSYFFLFIKNHFLDQNVEYFTCLKNFLLVIILVHFLQKPEFIKIYGRFSINEVTNFKLLFAEFCGTAPNQRYISQAL